MLNLPPQYREVLYWRITDNPRQMVWLNLLGIPLMLAVGALGVWFAFLLGGLQEIELGLGEWIALIPGLVLTLALHELAHGLTMRVYGARPEYGFMWHALYATAPGYAFTRNQYLVIAIMPMLALSVLAALGIILLSGWGLVKVLVLCAAANASGAGGDVWMFKLVAGYPASAYVVDEKDGIRVFVKE